MLRKLDLGPGQQKAVREQVAKMRDLLRQERSTLESARADVGASFGAEALDRDALDAALQAPEQALARIRAELVAAMATIHDVLDAELRARFAGLVSGR